MLFRPFIQKKKNKDKWLEITVHCAFVDFRKVFDSLEREREREREKERERERERQCG